MGKTSECDFDITVDYEWPESIEERFKILIEQMSFSVNKLGLQTEHANLALQQLVYEIVREAPQDNGYTGNNETQLES